MNSREQAEPRRKKSMAPRQVVSSDNNLQQVSHYLKENWKTILSEVVSAAVTAYMASTVKAKESSVKGEKDLLS